MELNYSKIAAITLAVVLSTAAFAQSSRASSPATQGSKVDLNTATAKELDQLPGVGKATANRSEPAAQAPSPSVPGTAAPAAAPAPGMVWVNTDTKVYHREGDRYYGKTKHGKYMTESEAIQAGYRAAKNAAKTK